MLDILDRIIMELGTMGLCDSSHQHTEQREGQDCILLVVADLEAAVLHHSPNKI